MVSDDDARGGLSPRAIQRWLNARPNWGISLRRIYYLLHTGEIPSRVLFGSHNSHYRVTRDALEKWARGVEAGAERRQRARG